MRLTLLPLLVFAAACAGNGGTRPDPDPEPDPTGAPVEVYVSTGDRAKLLSRETDVRFRDGAALTDASAYLIQNKLSADQREALLQELFGRNPGVGFSFTRVDMGASDFSLRHY